MDHNHPNDYLESPKKRWRKRTRPSKKNRKCNTEERGAKKHAIDRRNVNGKWRGRQGRRNYKISKGQSLNNVAGAEYQEGAQVGRTPKRPPRQRGNRKHNWNNSESKGKVPMEYADRFSSGVKVSPGFYGFFFNHAKKSTSSTSEGSVIDSTRSLHETSNTNTTAPIFDISKVMIEVPDADSVAQCNERSVDNDDTYEFSSITVNSVESAVDVATIEKAPVFHGYFFNSPKSSMPASNEVASNTGSLSQPIDSQKSIPSSNLNMDSVIKSEVVPNISNIEAEAHTVPDFNFNVSNACLNLSKVESEVTMEDELHESASNVARQTDISFFNQRVPPSNNLVFKVEDPVDVDSKNLPQPIDMQQAVPTSDNVVKQENVAKMESSVFNHPFSNNTRPFASSFQHGLLSNRMSSGKNRQFFKHISLQSITNTTSKFVKEQNNFVLRDEYKMVLKGSLQPIMPPPSFFKSTKDEHSGPKSFKYKVKRVRNTRFNPINVSDFNKVSLAALLAEKRTTRIAFSNEALNESTIRVDLFMPGRAMPELNVQSNDFTALSGLLESLAIASSNDNPNHTNQLTEDSIGTNTTHDSDSQNTPR